MNLTFQDPYFEESYFKNRFLIIATAIRKKDGSLIAFGVANGKLVKYNVNSYDSTANRFNIKNTEYTKDWTYDMNNSKFVSEDNTSYHIISFEGSANTATTCKNGQITFYTNYDGNIGNNILDYNQAKAKLFHFSKSTIAKLNKSDNIYYKTNLFGIFMQENGNKIPLSIPRNILTINPSNSLIVQNNSSLTINNYGKLQNKGNIIVKSGSAIYAQAVSETAASNSWNNVPSNLDDVAIDNNNGTIKLESGSIIDDVDKNNSKHPIIIGGTVDISDLIKLDGSQIKLKNSDIIKTGFYNTTIKLFPDDFNISNISTSGFTQIFQNIKFYSDNNGTVRHSTILVPSIVKLQENTDNANVTKYGTDKPVVVVSPVSIGNILKLFYSTSDVNKILALDESKRPIKIESSGRTISIYDFLNNPSSFGITSESYAVDLSSFGIEGTSIDYSKLNDTSILNKVQFVVNKKLDILPKPSGSTELTIGQEFNNYPGVLILNPSITKLIISNKSSNTYYYNIKLNNNMSIEADGNINLTLYNTGEINLAELTKTGSGILSLSKKNVNDSTSLVINVASSNIDINKNNVINVYPSVNLQFTGS